MKINFKKFNLKYKYNLIISFIFVFFSFVALIFCNYFFSQKNYQNNLNLTNYKKFIFAISQNEYSPETIINILIKGDKFEKDKFLKFFSKEKKKIIKEKLGFFNENQEYFDKKNLLRILQKNFKNFDKNKDDKNFIDKIRDNYLSILKNENIYHSLNLKFLHKSLSFLDKLVDWFPSFGIFKLFLKFLSYFDNHEFKTTVNTIFSNILSSFNHKNKFFFYVKKILSPFSKENSFLKKIEKIFFNKKLLNFLNVIKKEFLNKKKIKNFSDFFLIFSKKKSQTFLTSLYKKLFYYKTLKNFLLKGKKFLKIKNKTNNFVFKKKEEFNEIEKETWIKIFVLNKEKYILNNEQYNLDSFFKEKILYEEKWKKLYKEIVKKILFIYNEDDIYYKKKFKIKDILNDLWENGAKKSKNNDNILLLYKYKYFFNLNFYNKILNSNSNTEFIENKNRIFKFLKDYYDYSIKTDKNVFFNYLKETQNYSFKNNNLDIKSNKGNNFHLHIIKDNNKNNLFKVSFKNEVKYFFLNEQEKKKLKEESETYKIDKIENFKIIIKNFLTNKKIYFLNIFKNIIKKLYTLIEKLYNKKNLTLEWKELIKKFPIFKEKLYNFFLEKINFKKIIKYSVRSYFSSENIYTKFFYLNVRSYKKIILKKKKTEEILKKLNIKNNKYFYFNYSNFSYFSILIKYFLKFTFLNKGSEERQIEIFSTKFKNIKNDLINFFSNNEIFIKKIKNNSKINLIDIFLFLKEKWNLISEDKKTLKEIIFEEKENIINRFLIQKITKFLEVKFTFRNLIDLENFNYFFKNILITLKKFFNKKNNFIFNFLIQLFKKIKNKKEEIVNFKNWKFFNLYHFFNNIFKNFYFDDKSFKSTFQKLKKNITLILKSLEQKIRKIEKEINNKWKLNKNKIKSENENKLFYFKNFQFDLKMFKINKTINN